MEYNNDNRQNAATLNSIPQSGGTEKPKRKTGRIALACIGLAAAAAMIIVFVLGIVSSAPPAGSASTMGNTDITHTPAADDTGSERGTVSYSQMTYQRPELGKIFDLIDRSEEYSDEADYEKLISTLDEVYAAYWTFDTMYNLANLKSCIDTTDEFYYGECLYFAENYPILSQKIDEMLYELAAGPLSERLDEDYYEADYLAGYTGESDYSDELVELYQKESDLVYRYQALTSDPEITVDGEQVKLYDYLSSAYSYHDYYGAVEQYYNEYNSPAAEIYIELVRTRKAIAEYMGYDSYIDYAYAGFSRDYSPDSVRGYIHEVCLGAVPLYKQLTESGKMDLSYYPGYLSEGDNLAALKESCEKMGGDVQTIFEYMEKYSLYDITASDLKLNNSFQTYFEDWNAPFIMLYSQNTKGDYTAFAHEFGHFIDAYVNYNSNITIDASEACSQAMEYLAAIYAPEELSDVLYAKMLDTVELYAVQGAYNAFEETVYALQDSELTVDNINRIAHETFVEYGAASESVSDYGGKSWIDVNHFFSNPFYIVSYIVANDAAYQIYRLELDAPGTGVKTFMKLADRDWGKSYLENADAIGLDASLSKERASEIVESLNSYFTEQ